MKKYSIVLALASIMFLIVECENKKECLYGDTEYNEETNECDCRNWIESEIPYLSPDAYNSVRTVRMNYDYRVKSYSDYPYYNHQGDTIKVYGWFWFGETDGGIHGDSALIVGAESPTLMLTNIQNYAGLFDMEDTCFIIGILEFLNHNGEKVVTEPTEECFFVDEDDYVLRVIDIHN